MEKKSLEMKRQKKLMGYPILYITGKDVLCSGKREKRKKGDKHGSERATHVKDGNAR